MKPSTPLPVLVHRFRLSTFLVTCSAGWERRAISELKRALPELTCRQLFMPGNLLVNTELPRAEALAALEDLETTVIGRVVPLDLRVDIGKGPESLEWVLVAAGELMPLEPEGTFRVVCHRRGEHEFDSRALEQHVGNALGDQWGLAADLEWPDQVLSVEVFQNLAFVSLCWPEELLRKEIVQIRREGERPLNRAELKLREALECFNLTLIPGSRALDLGSAPGGWAKVLVEHGALVVAVDPAALDERVAALPQVTHVRQRAQEYLTGAEGPFDLLTCDMNLHPVEAAELVAAAGEMLRPGAPALMTIKFQTRKRRRHVEEALVPLQKVFVDFTVQHLPHNGKETTLFMRRAVS